MNTKCEPEFTPPANIVPLRRFFRQKGPRERVPRQKARTGLKIGLLAIGGSHWIAGVNYVVNLASALLTLPECERPEIYLVEQASTDRHLYNGITSQVATVPWPGNRADALWRRLKPWGKPATPVEVQARTMKREGINCIFPCKFTEGVRYGIPWLGWAVDFQHKHCPEFFDKAQIEERDTLFLWHGENAPLVVNSSRCALDDFDRFYPGFGHKQRVLNFRTVPDPNWFAGDVDAIVRKRNLPRRYLMTPNQFFAHKNHRCVLEALKLLREAGTDASLICTGNTEDFRRPDYFSELTTFIKAAGLQPYVHVLGLLPRFEQIQLMRGALAIVQPSLFEGWSTVVEDARALGKRIFLSDIPVHREQNPPMSVYFDPLRPELLARCIGRSWADLRPGPIIEEERAATNAHPELVTLYALDFMGIVRELVELPESHMRLSTNETA